jgi:5-methylcytosine-specific restriction endonuclease McrA
MSKGWKGGSTSEWRKLREIVFKRDGAICVQCGEDERTKLHIDHIIPKRLVGDSGDQLDNLQVLCQKCNLSKGGRFFDEVSHPRLFPFQKTPNASVSHDQA